MVTVRQALPKLGRVLRQPTHEFYLEHFPFAITTFCCAPVLPGETLKNATFQSRVVTDPIVNKLMGWWIEYYFFYVKHRDLGGRADFTEMMLDPTKNMDAYRAGASDPGNYMFAGGLQWPLLCKQRVVETYFRNEGEATGFALVKGQYAAALNKQNWADSAALKDDYVIADTQLTVGADDVVTGSEVSKLMNMWELQRAHNMTDMTYEQFLATYTGDTPRVETHRPELLRHVREWQYPSNTINPADGSAKSAVSWAISDRLDKDRYFSEPGFIYGCTICRPKMYWKNQDGSMVGLLDSALAWLPAIMKGDPQTSLHLIPENKGPLQSIVTDTDGYVVDVKDLFLYGDQFISTSAGGGTDINNATLPTATLANKDYPVDADIDKLFVGTTDPTRRVRQDGIVRLSILGSLVDTTPPHGTGTSGA